MSALQDLSLKKGTFDTFTPVECGDGFEESLSVTRAPQKVRRFVKQDGAIYGNAITLRRFIIVWR